MPPPQQKKTKKNPPLGNLEKNIVDLFFDRCGMNDWHEQGGKNLRLGAGRSGNLDRSVLRTVFYNLD